MTADDLLNILEKRDLVASGVIATLRKQVAAAGRPIAPASIVKVLIDKQELTPRQGEQLLQSAAPGASSSAKPAAQPARPASPSPSSSSLEEELGLAPSKSSSSGVPAYKPVAAQPAKVVSPSTSSLSLEEELGLAPSKSSASGVATVKPVAAQPVKVAAPSKSSSSLEEELGLAPSKSSASGVATVKPVAAQPVKVAAPSKSSSSLEEELGLAPSKSSASGVATVKPVAAQPAVAKATPAKPATAKSATAKPAAAVQPAASSAASDLGLDDLLSEDGGGGGLFDEGLLGAAAEELPGEPFGAPAGNPLSAALAATPTALTAVAPAAPRRARPGRWKKALGVVAGALGALLLVAGIAAAVLLRGTGDPEFQLAEADYRAGAWPAAVTKYDDLLRNYPGQVHASAARVHRGLAQIRSELGERTQWPKVLEVAERVLPSIASEPEFNELRSELGTILTDTADALARSADETDDLAEVERRVGQGRRALALATDAKIVPPADRPWQRLQEIDDRLAVLARDVERPPALSKALDEIQQATARPDPAAGLAARDKLVERFPDLAANEQLREKLAALVAAELALVKPSGDKPRPALREERSSSIRAWTLLVAEVARPAGAKPGAPASVYGDGARYGLDSASGKVLWRRYVGRGPATAQVRTLPGEAAQGAGMLLVDARYHDLVRIAADSGQLQWRQAIDEPLTGPPTLSGAAAYVSTQAGSVQRIDLATGQRTHAVRLPSPAVGAPLASSDGRHLFQLTAQGELFALAAADLAGTAALYLGGESGGLAYAPCLAGRYVVVVDNQALDESSLRVVGLDAQGLPSEVAGVVPIAGRIAAQPTMIGNHLIVVNEHGAVSALEITGQRDAPLKISSQVPGTAPAAEWFVVEAGTQFWVAGAGLRALELKKGRLSARRKPAAEAIFDTPPVAFGSNIVGICRAPGADYGLAVAVSPTGARLWEIALGGLPDRVAAADAADWPVALRLASVSQSGGQTQLDWKQASAQQTLERFAPGVRLSGGRWLWWRGSAVGGSVLLGSKQGPLPVQLPAGAATLPVALGGGLLMPVSDGALMLLDPATGKPLATALRPNVVGGQTVRWTAPVLSPKGTEAIIADDHPTLYLVGLKKDPQPQLFKVIGTGLEAPVAAGPVVAGASVYLVTRDGMLRAYDLSGLKPAGEHKLPSRLVSWMGAAGDTALVASGSQLLGTASGKKPPWSVPLEAGPPCGVPLATDKGIVVASSGGRVMRLDAATGKLLGKTDVDQPLVAGPLPAGEGACTVRTADGCLLEIAIP